jgi:DNA processing protein
MTVATAPDPGAGRVVPLAGGATAGAGVPDAWRTEERRELAALCGLAAMTPRRLWSLCGPDGPRAAWRALARGDVRAAALAAGGARRSGATTARLERLVARWHEAAAATRPEDLVEGWARQGIEVLVAGDDAFPAPLARRPGAPVVLWCAGARPAGAAGADAPSSAWPGGGAPCVALTGTRSSTAYGERVASCLAEGLAAAGVEVVTTLEAGIDAAMRAGALRGGGPLSALAAAGVDQRHPPGAWQAVVEGGGRVLSDARVGARPERWRFPHRNGMLGRSADALVVVEAHTTGGAMHAVEAALEVGVAVGAVPGSVHSPSSRGSNALLLDGAHVVRQVEDVLAVLAVSGAPAVRVGGGARPVGVVDDRRPAPDGVDGAVLAALDEELTVHLDRVLAVSGLSLPIVAAALERLVDGGHARRAVGGYLRTPERGHVRCADRLQP